MSLQFVRVKKQPELLERLVDWYNLQETRHLYVMYPNAAAYRKRMSLEDVRARLGAKDPKTFRMHVVLENEKPIGHMSVEVGSHLITKKRSSSAWISVAIAVPTARGRGVGKTMMKKLERYAKDMGASRIELGVFEFNQRAHKFYESLGYQHIGRHRRATWWNGQMWDALLMERLI